MSVERWCRRLIARVRGRSNTAARLRAAEAKYRTLVEQLPLVTYIDALTASATSLYASPQVEALLGYTVDEWLTDPEFFPKLLHPDDRERILALVEHCNRTGELFEAEYRLIARDGRTVWVQDESLVVEDAEGRKLFTQGYLLDISARKESEQRLAAEHATARIIAEAQTVEEGAAEVARVMCEAFGWDDGTLWPADGGEGSLGSPAALAAWRSGEPVWTGDAYAVPVMLGPSVLGVLELRGATMREPDQNLAGTIAVVSTQLAQLIERKRNEAALQHQALHDVLTGLPNRALFHDRVQHALEHAGRSGDRFAVLVMDLDCFKDVNDTLGHQYGDALLHELGRRLHGCVRASETVARLGGDEFGFLLGGAGEEEADVLVERVQRALAEPFTVHEFPIELEASLGIAFHPEHGDTVDQLVQRADVAMYVAKRAGVMSAVYDPREDHNTRTRLTIGGELRRALEQRELTLLYQPQVELATGAVAGVEAVLSWQHPTHGLLEPEVLRPIAERAGLVECLTRYVIGSALAQRAEWDADWPIAVNVSMRSLDRREFASEVEALLEEHGVPARHLKLEITESSAVPEATRAASVLARLRGQGARVALDHLGTRQASFGSLDVLPLDEVKLDSTLPASITSDAGSRAIVAAMIELATDLGLDSVADGVTTPDSAAALLAMGCRFGQGRHWCSPVSAERLTRWLAAPRAGKAEGRAA
jgi:diguanylate cyclase (GGDEF)-like protein/PAS domain S-box-containing protein